MTRISKLLDEMRDLGWSGDADAWQVDADACDPEDRADFTLDLTHEVRLMRHDASEEEDA